MGDLYLLLKYALRSRAPPGKTRVVGRAVVGCRRVFVAGGARDTPFMQAYKSCAACSRQGHAIVCAGRCNEVFRSFTSACGLTQAWRLCNCAGRGLRQPWWRLCKGAGDVYSGGIHLREARSVVHTCRTGATCKDGRTLFGTRQVPASAASTAVSNKRQKSRDELSRGCRKRQRASLAPAGLASAHAHGREVDCGVRTAAQSSSPPQTPASARGRCGASSGASLRMLAAWTALR